MSSVQKGCWEVLVQRVERDTWASEAWRKTATLTSHITE